ncbi:DUF6192 family protein [Amycolatopsis azurea]
MPVKIGNVTQHRYDQSLAEAREAVEFKTRAQFRIGGLALVVEPLRPHGGSAGEAEELMTVSEALRRFADDIGPAYSTVKSYRWVSARWPDKRLRRQHRTVSHTVFRTLAAITDPDERARVLAEPPVDRWTPDAAKRVVDWAVDTPSSPQEKINRIHDLAADDDVAAAVATDLLRRPEVASRAMTDSTARHVVNRAQIDHAHQAGEIARQRTPAIENLAHSSEFVDLVGACSVFVASVGRVLPTLRGQPVQQGRTRHGRHERRPRAQHGGLDRDLRGDRQDDDGRGPVAAAARRVRCAGRCPRRSVPNRSASLSWRRGLPG